ncbi:MAG: cell division protein FtsX [Candidatus Lumbricidophila eiseniae]|uniref:Cell division protein FtsX n=1 Tax=Candidatus Lumbricidiphila eiseniae TaxID=1969409 RepID=A0A2A6FQW9_9MICO|nr:MAG: cell division protein FtsX [Candidatus Lumbricidophila eiseniae]
MRIGLMLSEAFNGLRRNATMVISVILVTFISLTFVGAAVLLQVQIGLMKGYWYDRAEVTVYLCNTVSSAAGCSGGAITDEQKTAVQDRLASATLAPYVQKLYFVDQQTAYKDFTRQFSGAPNLAFVTPDLLPAQFHLKLVNPNKSGVIKEGLAGMAGVDDVTDQRALLGPVFSLLNTASYTALALAAIMLVAAMLLIATTIRLSAFSRRRELGIMRLVGASNRFIQTPFVLEGVFAGLVGSLLAGGAIVAIVRFFIVPNTATNPLVAYVGTHDALLAVPLLVGVGVLLAAVSASIAIRRYLKV